MKILKKPKFKTAVPRKKSNKNATNFSKKTKVQRKKRRASQSQELEQPQRLDEVYNYNANTSDPCKRKNRRRRKQSSKPNYEQRYQLQEQTQISNLSSYNDYSWLRLDAGECLCEPFSNEFQDQIVWTLLFLYLNELLCSPNSVPQSNNLPTVSSQQPDSSSYPRAPPPTPLPTSQQQPENWQQSTQAAYTLFNPYTCSSQEPPDQDPSPASKMQRQSGLGDFRCKSSCNHKECQRHAHLGIINPKDQCKCLGDLDPSTVFLENVIDMSNTLAQIMIICGIHECKAKSSVDVITYAFLHYDQVCYCMDTAPRKRLRKEDIFNELGKKCLMNRVEAHLAYTIIKRGFKAFYYKPPEQYNKDGRPSFSEECAYVHAARKTSESYARYDGLSCEEQRGFEAKIRVAYKKFYDRMQTRKNRPADEECNCCFCAKKRGHLVYGKPPPPEPGPPKRKEPNKCPYCCRKKKQQMVHAGRQGAFKKCPKCHRLMRNCICPKYEFELDWVKSIWHRNDMDLYFKENIEAIRMPFACGEEEEEDVMKGCDSQEISEDDVEEEEEVADAAAKPAEEPRPEEPEEPEGEPEPEPQPEPEAAPADE